MSRTDPQFNLRIPQELRDRVMAAAQANKRSATAEILARLEASFLEEGHGQDRLSITDSYGTTLREITKEEFLEIMGSAFEKAQMPPTAAGETSSDNLSPKE